LPFAVPNCRQQKKKFSKHQGFQFKLFSGLQQKMPFMNMNGVNIILYLYFHQIEIFQMMKNVFALQTGIYRVQSIN